MKTYEITDTKIENKACYLVIKGKKDLGNNFWGVLISS